MSEQLKTAPTLPGLVLAIILIAVSIFECHVHAQESKSKVVSHIRGKTFDSWIGQVKGGRTLERSP